MELRRNARWAVAVPTSMGIRIAPEHGQPVHLADRFRLQVTSAETNAASVPAALGLPVKVLTAFVAGSPISAIIKADLRKRGMTYEGPDLPQGDAWGLRHQFNIADSGFGGRAPRVWNDRAGEVGRELALEHFDLDRLFAAEGVRILHLSGLIAAISPHTSAFCVELARVAREHGTAVSMDLNYRASFWAGREEELSAAFHAIAQHCDLLYGNEEDFQLCLGVPGPEPGGEDLDSQLGAFTSMIGRVREAFPRASYVGTSLREVITAGHHRWGLVLWSAEGGPDGTVGVCPLRDIEVLDRIGGGDGSVGGVLYGVLRGWDVQRCAEFGWASGALAASSSTDHAAPADEEQVWSIWEGNARVQR